MPVIDPVCPDCRSRLSSELVCAGCHRSFERIDTTPILLHGDSIFTAEQVTSGGSYFGDPSTQTKLKVRIRRALPSLAGDTSVGLEQRYLQQLSGHGLIVGAGSRRSMISDHPQIDWTTTDVDMTFDPDAVADVTALPYEDGAFDVVLAEHVIEHVASMETAAAEMQRVCAVGGLIVVRVPFNHPWHGVPYDFFRCTPTGLRSLFRHCDVVELCAGQGPAGAVAYLSHSLIVGYGRTPRQRRILTVAARTALGWLDLLDRRRRRVPMDSAGTLTFVGRRSEQTRSTAAVIDEVEGLLGSG